MAVQMPARLLPACRACFLVSFLCLNVEIHGGVMEYRPLKKSSNPGFQTPLWAPPPKVPDYVSNTSDFSLLKKTLLYDNTIFR